MVRYFVQYRVNNTDEWHIEPNVNGRYKNGEYVGHASISDLLTHTVDLTLFAEYRIIKRETKEVINETVVG